MPGNLLHEGAVVTCFHGGMATPTVPNPRVLVSGMPTVLQVAPWVVAGCALPPPPIANGPCVIGEWVTGTVRVTSSGVPLVLFPAEAVCEIRAPASSPRSSRSA